MPTSSPTRGLRCARAGASRSPHRGRQGGPAPSIELSTRSDAADRPVRRAQGSWMGPARSQPPRAHPPHSCTLPSMALPSSPPTATWPSRRRRQSAIAARMSAPRVGGEHGPRSAGPTPRARELGRHNSRLLRSRRNSFRYIIYPPAWVVAWRPSESRRKTCFSSLDCEFSHPRSETPNINTHPYQDTHSIININI